MVKEMLVTQFGFMYGTLELNLEGLDTEDSLVQPRPQGNCANWILGHLVWAQNGVNGILGEAPVWDDPSLDRDWDEPIRDASEALDWDALRTEMLSSKPRVLAAIGGLSAEELEEGGFTDPFGTERTRAGMLAFLAFHQIYHAGQLAVSRRLAGKSGRIRQPRGSD
jgi:hypothetical protein